MLVLQVLLLVIALLCGGCGYQLHAKADEPIPKQLLQTNIDAALATGVPLVLQSGIYEVPATLNIRQQEGFQIRGSGHGYYPLDEGHDARLKGTVLRWTGPAGGTMFNLAGSIFLTFTDLSLSGNGGIGFYVQYMNGWGTGLMEFERVGFTGFDVAIQCGNLPTESNCADLCLRSIVFDKCRKGLYVKTQQGVNYRLDNIAAGLVGQLVHFEWGGNLTMTHCSGWGVGTYLKVDNADLYNGTYIIDGMRLEQHPGLESVIVNANAAWNGRIVLNGIHETSGVSPDYLFRIGPGMRLSVSNSMFESQKLLHITSDVTRRSYASFRECDFMCGGQVLPKVTKVGSPYVKFWDGCRNHFTEYSP